MRRWLLRSVLAGLWLGLGSAAFAATELSSDHVQVRLIPLPAPAAGELAFGIEFRIDPQWHIYWQNPGDSGAAPKFKVEAQGGKVSGPDWPAPERIPYGTLTNYGYNRRVVFPFLVKLDPGSPSLDLKVGLEWLVCKVDCIPGFGKLDTVLARDSAPGPIEADPLHPLPKTDPAWSLRLQDSGGPEAGFELKNPQLDWKELREVEIFPLDGELFATRAPTFQLEGDKLRIKIPWDANAKREKPETAFVLKYRQGDRAWQAVRLKTGLQAAPSPAGLARFLFLAFLGGILLNLMPCVFPVLSIKALSLAREAHDRSALRRSGWSYTLGVLVAFGILGGALLLLRAGGQALGWGFQLQSPLFVFAMALLFFV
ncbi:MAG TPA: protein-disulfide reductase DsbD domain-containing protein, partial [bacterium]|nr:protein-disulfide reductase DsbD domain-containing protein [bacterium]